MTLQNNSSSPSALLFCPHHKLEQMVVAHCWQLGKFVAVVAFIKYSLKCDKISVIKKRTPLRTVEPQQRCGVMTLWWRESQCQAVYCMAMKWRRLKVPTSTGTLFGSMQEQRRNPDCVIASCRHQLSRSSWAKLRLSPPLALTTGHLTYWRKWTLHCTV